MTPLVRSFLQLYRWLSAPCLPYNYFIIFVRFIENVLHFHFRLKIQTQHFIVPQACTCFVKVCQTCISFVSIHIKTASKMKQNRKYTEKMYGWLASAEKVECGWILSFCRHKPINSRPLMYVKLRNSGNPLLISHDFCYFCSGQRTRLFRLGFVIEDNLFRNLLKAFLSLFIQTAYHLKFSVFDKALAP